MLINKINDILKFNGDTGIVLGSGLDHIVKLLRINILYHTIILIYSPNLVLMGIKVNLFQEKLGIIKYCWLEEGCIIMRV